MITGGCPQIRATPDACPAKSINPDLEDSPPNNA